MPFPLALEGKKKNPGALVPGQKGEGGSPGKEIGSREMCHQQKEQLFSCISMAEPCPVQAARV